VRLLAWCKTMMMLIVRIMRMVMAMIMTKALFAMEDIKIEAE
jgi:hypothetical protein